MSRKRAPERLALVHGEKGLCRFGLAWMVVGLCVLGTACDKRRQAVCRFGAEHALASTDSASFDELSLVATKLGFVALYSDVRGLFALGLDPRGAPRAAERKLAERCEGGFDALIDHETLHLACLRPASDADPSDASAVTIYDFDAQLAEQGAVAFGSARRLSRGIALIRHGAGFACAYQDAGVGESRVIVAEVLHAVVTQRVVSDQTFWASAPSLVEQRGELFAAWAELQAGVAASPGRIMWSRLAAGAPALPLMATSDPAPAPLLLSVGDDFALAFRDRRSRARKTGLYLERLSGTGERRGQVLRVARADGNARPVVKACLGGIVAATPRRFAGDYFVGVVKVGNQLDFVSGEQQFYEDSHEFGQVALACDAERAMLLIAERGKMGQHGAALRSVPLACSR